MNKERTQRLILPTIVGDKELPAPSGWKFDATAVIVWAALLQHVRDGRRPAPELVRTKFARESRIYLLSNILANALGMAPPYWTKEAEAYA